PPPPLLYPLSLHDALPICVRIVREHRGGLADEADDDVTPRRMRRRAALEDEERAGDEDREGPGSHPRKATVFRRTAPNRGQPALDRKSTRLNSSHVAISYA